MSAVVLVFAVLSDGSEQGPVHIILMPGGLQIITEPLCCLLHLANNLCKDLGLGYPQLSEGEYRADILEKLGVNEEDLEKLRESVGEVLLTEVKALLAEST